MKVAIIGATGFIGRHLCDTHIGRGDSVSVLVRDPQRVNSLSWNGVTVIQGDLHDDEAIRQTCSRADVVYNVTGALGKWGVSSDEMEFVNHHAAGRVIRCAAEARASRVIHTSTAGVSGPLQGDICACEDDPPSPATEYQRTKHDGEIAAISSHRAMNIPLTIVRPAFVYGPGDTHKLSLFRTVAGRRMILVNGGRSRLHPVFVDDVVYGMIAAAERGAGQGERYIIAGPGPSTTRKLVETIAWALMVPKPKWSLPESLLLQLARTAEAVGGIMRKEPPLTCSKVKLLSEDYAYSIDKARQELQFKPVVSLSEGIIHTVRWYRERGYLK